MRATKASRRRRHAGDAFGSAVRVGDLDREPNLRAAVIRECEQLVPEFEMNWNAIEPEYGQLSFAKIDALTTFAIANGKNLRGHRCYGISACRSGPWMCCARIRIGISSPGISVR